MRWDFKKELNKKEIQSLISFILNNNIKRIVITGPPGSGKTTLAKRISQEIDIFHIESDHYLWQKEKGGDQRGEFITDIRRLLQREDYILEGHIRRIKGHLEISSQLHIHLSLPQRKLLSRLMRRDIIEFLKRKRKTSDFYWYLFKHSDLNFPYSATAQTHLEDNQH